jgi:hypothetical protein
MMVMVLAREPEKNSVELPQEPPFTSEKPPQLMSTKSLLDPEFSQSLFRSQIKNWRARIFHLISVH